MEPNDVILSRIVPHIRRCWIVPESAQLKQIGSGEWIVFRSTKADPKYLRHFLLSNPFHSMFMSTVKGVGGSLLRADPKQVARFKIPLPPLKTQQRIAAILDDAAALRDKTDQLLIDYDLLAQSIFLDLMNNIDGDKIPLSEISLINPRKSEIANVSKDTLVTFLPMASVSENGAVDKSIERSIKDVWSGFTYFAEGDVLFAKITPCMENGKGCVARGLKNHIGFGSTEFHILRSKDGVTTSDWLYHLLNTERFRKISEANMRGSAGQKRVPKDFFDRFKIKVPSISVQTEFAEKIVLIERQKELAKQKLQESEDLFNCLLQKAFKGELGLTIENW